MATNTIFGAGMNIILILNSDAYVGSSTFFVGGLAGISFDDLIWPLAYVIGGLIVSTCVAQRLNILALLDVSFSALDIHAACTMMALCKEIASKNDVAVVMIVPQS